MRIRMIKPVAGVLDGVSLGHLIPDLTYDLDESLAAYLVSIRAAEALSRADSPFPENTDDSLFEHVIQGVTITNRNRQVERAVGHDRPQRSRRKRR